jgi:hypothetical protein
MALKRRGKSAASASTAPSDPVIVSGARNAWQRCDLLPHPPAPAPHTTPNAPHDAFSRLRRPVVCDLAPMPGLTPTPPPTHQQRGCPYTGCAVPGRRLRAGPPHRRTGRTTRPDNSAGRPAGRPARRPKDGMPAAGRCRGAAPGPGACRPRSTRDGRTRRGGPGTKRLAGRGTGPRLAGGSAPDTRHRRTARPAAPRRRGGPRSTRDGRTRNGGRRGAGMGGSQDYRGFRFRVTVISAADVSR